MQVARKKARNKNLLKAARTLINKQLSNPEHSNSNETNA